MTSIVSSTLSFIVVQSPARPQLLQPGCRPRHSPCQHGGVLLAHQGGWDEALLVLVPLAVFAVLLRRARKRAEQEAAATPDTTD